MLPGRAHRPKTKELPPGSMAKNGACPGTTYLSSGSLFSSAISNSSRKFATSHSRRSRSEVTSLSFSRSAKISRINSSTLTRRGVPGAVPATSACPWGPTVGMPSSPAVKGIPSAEQDEDEVMAADIWTSAGRQCGIGWGADCMLFWSFSESGASVEATGAPATLESRQGDDSSVVSAATAASPSHIPSYSMRAAFGQFARTRHFTLEDTTLIPGFNSLRRSPIVHFLTCFTAAPGRGRSPTFKKNTPNYFETDSTENRSFHNIFASHSN